MMMRMPGATLLLSAILLLASTAAQDSSANAVPAAQAGGAAPAAAAAGASQAEKVAEVDQSRIDAERVAREQLTATLKNKYWKLRGKYNAALAQEAAAASQPQGGAAADAGAAATDAKEQASGKADKPQKAPKVQVPESQKISVKLATVRAQLESFGVDIAQLNDEFEQQQVVLRQNAAMDTAWRAEGLASCPLGGPASTTKAETLLDKELRKLERVKCKIEFLRRVLEQDKKETA